MGTIIENAIRKSSFPISLLAKKMGKSRRHIYDLFERAEVSLEIVIQIGQIINYDFSNEVRELKKTPENLKYDLLIEPNSIKDSASFWRSKYVELLEKHQLLLERNLLEYFKK
jgi:hypothetical protein